MRNKPTIQSHRWLESQPKSSVLLLCFGSRGNFNREQVREIAIAIERSGYRFIWSLRQPPSEDLKSFPGEYTDYNEVLPDGFLERTAGKGKVAGWVPKTEGSLGSCGDWGVCIPLWVELRTGELLDQSLVSAADIEKGIREVMDNNSEVRAKVMEMKAKSRLALDEGGSSSACLRHLLDDLISFN
ncbi:hypothetical protein Tco_1266845 [Tanacetum coccineum]